MTHLTTPAKNSCEITCRCFPCDIFEDHLIVTKAVLPSQLGLQNTLIAPLQRSKTTAKSVLI